MSRQDHEREHGRDRERPRRRGQGREYEHRRDGAAPGDAHGRTHDEKRTTERYGLDGPGRPLNDRTGNEIVNDGPLNGTDDHGFGDEPPRGSGTGGRDGLHRPFTAPGSSGTAPGGSGTAPGGSGKEQEALSQDELALRRMLHSTVGDLEPSVGALDHLRRAVPVRRARKRQALVGAAASVILLGTAVPAFVHVANSGGFDDRPVNAGHGEQAQGGTGSEQGGAGEELENGTPPGSVASRPGAPKAPQTSPSPGAGTTGTVAGVPVAPSGSSVASAPACTPAQLGVDGTQVAAPDADGKVYGTFRIANASDSACTVNGIGAVGFQAAGAADSKKISVVTHVTGDAASGLPDPSAESGTLVLKPQAAYEVKFAFVPSETCPTTDPSPDPTPSQGGSSGATDGAGATGTEPQLAAADGGTADGSISVTHTPEAGGLKAEAAIPDACAGTIYRTGILAPS
ncbi:hypothetical protein [Streptomyces sp. NPDC059176]|uniref:hypothetical protein n=1 Tax=Streptomyces sp. NPDC059176 TaxID=3346758 RepID=UPI00368C0437